MSPHRPAWLALWLAASAVTTSTVLTGQVSVYLAVPATLAWWTARRHRWRAAGACSGLVVAAKPFAAPLVLWLLLDRERRAGVVPAAAAIALSFGAGAAWFGWDVTAAWVTQLGRAEWWWTSLNASVPGLIARCLIDTPFYAPLFEAPRAVTPLAAACAAALVLLSIGRAHRADIDCAFVLLYLGSILASPLGWVYYGWFAVGPGYALLAEDRVPRLATAVVLLGLLVPPYLVAAVRHPLWTVTIGSAYTYAFGALWLAAWRASTDDGRARPVGERA